MPGHGLYRRPPIIRRIILRGIARRAWWRDRPPVSGRTTRRWSRRRRKLRRASALACRWQGVLRARPAEEPALVCACSVEVPRKVGHRRRRGGARAAVRGRERVLRGPWRWRREDGAAVCRARGVCARDIAAGELRPALGRPGRLLLTRLEAYQGQILLGAGARLCGGLAKRPSRPQLYGGLAMHDVWRGSVWWWGLPAQEFLQLDLWREGQGRARTPCWTCASTRA